MIVAITAIGCGTGIIITTIDKIFGGRKEKREREARLAGERVRLQELQIVELRRQNELLQKQLEWHDRLLETQQRAAPLPSGEADAVRSR